MKYKVTLQVGIDKDVSTMTKETIEQNVKEAWEMFFSVFDRRNNSEVIVESAELVSR